LCNLYGDPANARLLCGAVPGASAAYTALNSRPLFLDGGADIVYIGSMTERGQAMAARALAPYRGGISECVDGGVRFLVTGNALEVFGRYIDCEDGSRIECLGLFDVYAKRDVARRYNGLYLGNYGEIEIVGFTSRFSHLYGDEDGALFETIRGVGRRPGERAEGLRRVNFMASYVLGPLLITNPLFAKELLRDMGAGVTELPFERAAMDAYNARLREFRNPKTGFDYGG
jgi:CobQ-like glutamine amidotransferase family enzyme